MSCFEVDHVEDLVNWNSAICWGQYEELQGEPAEQALKVLRGRRTEVLPRVMDHGQPAAEKMERDGSSDLVVFCIRLLNSSGREERLHWELLPVASELHQESFASTPAERWLTHERAQQLAQMCSILDSADLWTAADRLAEGRPVEQVIARLSHQGVEPEIAQRVGNFLVELRDSAPMAHQKKAPSIHAGARVEWADTVPEDVLAERDAEARGLVSSPAIDDSDR